jgi:NhaP-type Na+/H+ or K+/H+ antiporter
MPLTVTAIAAAGHWLLGMTWAEALLIGAILSPTDPVFVTAILEQEAVPARLQRRWASRVGSMTASLCRL